MNLRNAALTLAVAFAACSETSTSSVRDAAGETAPDAPVDIVDVRVADAPPDVTPDAPPDVPDAQPDVLDVPDAPRDAMVDTPNDLPTDAPIDAPVDARTDASACGDGLTACTVDGAVVCVDTNTDRNHCGGCGRACCAGAACFGGTCPLGCGIGRIRCGCVCVDPTTDSMNCGACGFACAAGQVCAMGTCVTAGCGGSACSAGLCACRGVCVDYRTDSSNCGGCGNACATGMFCMDGMCRSPALDGGVCASVTEPTPPSGVCDGRGRIACQNWASGMLDGGMAWATCVSTPAGCVRANACADISDPSTCTCGSGPACSPGQVCATDAAGVVGCRCIRSP